MTTAITTVLFGERCNMSKKKPGKTFGQFLRDKRVAKGFSLRKFAELVGVSPTYLSQVEQDNVDPPTADRVKRMAELLGESVDEWTALAGRLTEDLPEIIREEPTAVPGLLRAVRGLTADQLRRLRDNAEQMKSEGTAEEK
jgi:HTH-type transcriptional regulator, competence development regulator